jgi:hypothetical protein
MEHEPGGGCDDQRDGRQEVGIPGQQCQGSAIALLPVGDPPDWSSPEYRGRRESPPRSGNRVTSTRRSARAAELFIGQLPKSQARLPAKELAVAAAGILERANFV